MFTIVMPWFDADGNWTKSGIFMAVCIVFIIVMAVITYITSSFWAVIGIFLGILVLIVYSIGYQLVNYRLGFLGMITGLDIKYRDELPPGYTSNTTGIIINNV